MELIAIRKGIAPKIMTENSKTPKMRWPKGKNQLPSESTRETLTYSSYIKKKKKNLGLEETVNL